MSAPLDLDALDFDKGAGVVSVVAVDASDGAVLMVAFADREALERTIATGEMHYLSRTRGPWHKGATSGNVQQVVALVADCDADTVLAVVRPHGPRATRAPAAASRARRPHRARSDASTRWSLGARRATRHLPATSRPCSRIATCG